MFNRSRKTLVVALLTAAALTAGTLPSYARSAAYCRDYARDVAGSGDNSAMWILPLAALGAGAGALVGVAASGIAVSTGAIVGGASGATVGVAHTATSSHRDYDEAYAECRSAR